MQVKFNLAALQFCATHALPGRVLLVNRFLEMKANFVTQSRKELPADQVQPKLFESMDNSLFRFLAVWTLGLRTNRTYPIYSGT